jgi:uncharacterized membrane protein
VLAATVVGLLLRLYRLGAQSLWVDEAATYLSSVGSPVWVATQTQVDGSVPPLYFLLVNAAMRFGDGEVAVRAPSVIFGVLSIPLLFVVVRRWAGDAVAALSAALLAVAPFHVWYSQEARAYVVLVFLALGAIWALQTAFDRPGAWRPRAAFAVLAATAFYCHTLGLALVAVGAALVAIYEPPARWPGWVAVFAGAGLLILPGFLRYFTLSGYPSNRTDGTVGAAEVGFVLWVFSVGYSLGPSLEELHGASPARTALAATAVIAPVLVLIAALLALGARALGRRAPRALWSVLAVGVVPVAFSVAGSIVSRYPFNVRYVAVAFPAFVVLLASGVLSLRHAWARRVAGGALCSVQLLALGNYYHDPRYAREDNRGASAFIQRVGSLDRELVVVAASYTSVALDYYLRRSPRLVAPFPGHELHGDRARASRYAERLLGDRERFWIFLSRTYHSDESRLLLRYADSLFVRDTAYRGPGVAAIRYVRRPRPAGGQVTAASP